MELQPHPTKSNKAVITLENKDELEAFDYAAFDLSLFRSYPSLLLGIASLQTWRVVREYWLPRQKDSEFPRSLVVRNETLAHLAGNLLISHSDAQDDQLLNEITTYFSQRNAA